MHAWNDQLLERSFQRTADGHRVGIRTTNGSMERAAVAVQVLRAAEDLLTAQLAARERFCAILQQAAALQLFHRCRDRPAACGLRCAACASRVDCVGCGCGAAGLVGTGAGAGAEQLGADARPWAADGFGSKVDGKPSLGTATNADMPRLAFDLRARDEAGLGGCSADGVRACCRRHGFRVGRCGGAAVVTVAGAIAAERDRPLRRPLFHEKPPGRSFSVLRGVSVRKMSKMPSSPRSGALGPSHDEVANVSDVKPGSEARLAQKAAGEAGMLTVACVA